MLYCGTYSRKSPARLPHELIQHPKEKMKMFCQKCGHQVPDDATFCGQCGANLKVNTQPQAQPSVPPAPTNTNATSYTANTPSNTIAIVGFILSFFIALAGLICCIIGYNNAKKGAPYKGLSVAGIVISAVWMGIVFIAIITA